MRFLKQFTKRLPMLASAVLLAVAVWILAVTNIDPVERRTFGRPIPLEIIGLNASLIITSDVPEQVSLSLSAPISTWRSTLNSSSVIRAIVDVTGIKEGSYEVPINIQINARPVKIESVSPDMVTLTIEKLFKKTFNINLVQPSNPAIGYEATPPVLDIETADVNGPSSQVEKVTEVRATLDISQAQESIDREIFLVALDKDEARVQGVTISPEKVRIQQEITQRGGYKNVTVKVLTTGQISSGYRLTNISANPLVVTLFSTDPDLIKTLPGFIETQPLNLNDANEDLEVSLPLELPAGVIVVGESTIKVSVSISPIEGSITLNALQIEYIGVSPMYQTVTSPDRVDVILSGPLPDLETLKSSDVRVLLDLTEKPPGIYQIAPQVQVGVSGILVESILPATIEVEIKQSPPSTAGN